MYKAQTFMVQISWHWTERGSDDISLWSFTVKHWVWLYNQLPNKDSGQNPLENLTSSRSGYHSLLRCYVRGFPVFVLEPKLHNDQKHPKWNHRDRLGQFIGFSDEHSSLVDNMLHLRTVYLSPQLHLNF